MNKIAMFKYFSRKTPIAYFLYTHVFIYKPMCLKIKEIGWRNVQIRANQSHKSQF